MSLTFLVKGKSSAILFIYCTEPSRLALLQSWSPKLPHSPFLPLFVISYIKSVKLSIAMLFVRTLLLSFVLALSVAATSVTWVPSDVLVPLTDVEAADYLAKEGGQWNKLLAPTQYLVSTFILFKLCSCVSDILHSLVIR
jgi:hypothetical protein